MSRALKTSLLPLLLLPLLLLQGFGELLPAQDSSPAAGGKAGAADVALAFAKSAPAAPVAGAPVGSAGAVSPTPAVDRGRRSAAEGAGRREQATSAPWVASTAWEVPEAYGADVFEGMRTRLEPWSLFEAELDKASVLSCAPAYAGVEPCPLFTVLPPAESDFERKLKRLVKAKVYREMRNRLKREWRMMFREHPSMTYADYEQRLYQINNIGKEVHERDDFSIEHAAAEVRQTFLGKRRVDGESDIPLVAWGPFAVTDTGSMKFDLGTAAHTVPEDEGLAVGEQKRKPLLSTKYYRIDTDFNVDVDPFLGVSSGDARAAVRRFGVSFEVGWLSDVLGRELISTEIDLQSDLYGDFKGFFNIVIKGR